jgi:hypothetical protein
MSAPWAQKDGAVMMFKKWRWLDWVLLIYAVFSWFAWLVAIVNQDLHYLVTNAVWGDIFSIFIFLGATVAFAWLIVGIVERRKKERNRIRLDMEDKQEIDLLLTLRVALNQNLPTATKTLAEIGISISDDGVITVPDIFWVVKDPGSWKLLAESLISICKHYVRVNGQDDQRRLLCAQAVEKLLLEVRDGSPLWSFRRSSLIFAYMVKRMEGYFLWPKDHPLA